MAHGEACSERRKNGSEPLKDADASETLLIINQLGILLYNCVAVFKSREGALSRTELSTHIFPNVIHAKADHQLRKG